MTVIKINGFSDLNKDIVRAIMLGSDVARYIKTIPDAHIDKTMMQHHSQELMRLLMAYKRGLENDSEQH